MSCKEISEESLVDGDSEYEDEDDDMYDDGYYNNSEDDISENDDFDNDRGDISDNNNVKKILHDMEYFEYTCIPSDDIDSKFAEDCAIVSDKLKISDETSELLLQAHKWNISAVLQRYSDPFDQENMLVEAGVKNPSDTPQNTGAVSSSEGECGVCYDILPKNKLSTLSCDHRFCDDCWESHIEYTVNGGMHDGIKCMASNCRLRCSKSFVESLVAIKPELMQKFYRLLRNSRVSAHYQLRFCVGADCQMVMHAEVPKARLVECKQCQAAFCFDCGRNYHSPTDCETIAKWLTKCHDDSETANYICANTKSCPKCKSCIEKNGGCNHITCWGCKHHFCWLCLQNWDNHGSSYYACSKYQENPQIAQLSRESRAKEALKKYLFYFERWENHHRSILLEEEARKKILKQIEEKVMRNEGTWIDWQYLLRAGELLGKCRLTLRNTYPLAYYAPQDTEKVLFEFQQSQLEHAIEELSWKLERAGTVQRGEIENQMDVVRKHRHTLLSHFLRD